MSQFPPPALPTSPRPSPNGVRFGAYLLDILLAIVTCFIGWLVWSIVLWQQSTSPAKKMLKLRVVDSTTGAPAVMQQMIMRELVGKIALPVGLNLVGALFLGDATFGIGNLVVLVGGVMILASPSRQGVWDHIAKTTVVREG